MKGFKVFMNGIVDENPLLVMTVGLCTTLAVTTSVVNGICMGVATTFVLLMTVATVSLCRKLVPSSVRIPIFIMFSATYCTIISYFLQAYFPDLSKALGVFISLIAINCIIFARVEGFATKQPVNLAILDGLGMGIGFTWVLLGISIVREVLGNGTILGIDIFGGRFTPILFFVLPPGGFLVFAFFIGLIFVIKRHKAHAAA